MKFKLDENFGARTQGLFQEAGHDVKTVRDQKLQGCNDNTIYETCSVEKDAWSRWIWIFRMFWGFHRKRLLALQSSGCPKIPACLCLKVWYGSC